MGVFDITLQYLLFAVVNTYLRTKIKILAIQHRNCIAVLICCILSFSDIETSPHRN